MEGKESLKADDSNKDNINIFDELSSEGDGDFSSEGVSGTKKRNILILISHVLQVFSVLLILFFIVSLVYIQIQNKDDFKDSSLISPMCGVFLGDVAPEGGLCSSVTYMKETISKKIADESLKQTNLILGVLGPIYEKHNFTKTKSILFLSDKSKNKLKVISILEEFDELKTSFDFEKGKIKCSGINITYENTVSMNCEAFSAGFERGIRGFDGSSEGNIRGTSISIANSFINYIEKTSDAFSVINRQKIFTSDSVNPSETGFTNRTNFKLNLKYNSKTLSL